MSWRQTFDAQMADAKDQKVDHDPFADADDLLARAVDMGFNYPPSNDPCQTYIDRQPYLTACPVCAKEVAPFVCKARGPQQFRIHCCANGHNWWPCSSKTVESTNKYVVERDYAPAGAFKRILGPADYMEYIRRVIGDWINTHETKLYNLKKELKHGKATAAFF